MKINYWQKRDLPYLYFDGEPRFLYYNIGGYDVVYDRELKNVFIRGHRFGENVVFKNYAEAEKFIDEHWEGLKSITIKLEV